MSRNFSRILRAFDEGHAACPGLSRPPDEIDAVEPGGEDRQPDDDEEQRRRRSRRPSTSERSGRPFSQSGTRLKASAPKTTSPQPIEKSVRLKGWKISTSARMQMPMIVFSIVAAVLRRHAGGGRTRVSLMSAPPFRSSSKMLTWLGSQARWTTWPGRTRISRGTTTRMSSGAGAHMDQRLRAHRLDDLDRARNRPLRGGAGEAEGARPHPERHLRLPFGSARDRRIDGDPEPLVGEGEHRLAVRDARRASPRPGSSAACR